MHGTLNSPSKNDMPTSLFYVPRNEEMLHEDKLIQNHLNWEQRTFKNKAKLK